MIVTRSASLELLLVTTLAVAPVRAQNPTPANASPPSPGTVRENPKDGLKYAWIPPGTFKMGCSPKDKECDKAEKPSHQVIISKGFWIGQTEVTVGAYKRFAGATGRQMPPEPVFMGRQLNPGWGDEAMPIIDVTWDDAQAYCSWSGGRLPTEAEWEYAARAGSTAARYGNLDDIAWYADNSGRQRLDSESLYTDLVSKQNDVASYNKRLNENGNGPHEVGQKQANGFGLYDVLGNVWEWVNDWYDKDYYQTEAPIKALLGIQPKPPQDPSGPTSGHERVTRGGSSYEFPSIVRASERAGTRPASRYYDFGFRCGEEAVNP
jgi:formylglycine-generating enzyme required for sulfatase activity